MVKMKKALTFPSCFFFSVVAPLYLEAFYCFTPCDMILLIQDFDWMLGYDKSASSGVTSGNTMSTGAFNHFFNCDMRKMSSTPAKDVDRSSL
jgi:hypothetical protein